jgi:hypothetical protein
VILQRLDARPADLPRRVGFRCRAVHPDVGACDQPQGHESEDPWHYAVTNADPAVGTADHWRWRSSGTDAP